MNKIPVIGTAIVNGPHWLLRLIASIDYPVENFVIFNNNGKGEINEELDNIAKLKHKYIDKITVCHLPSNIGCSGAWNMIIKCYMNAPFWIITNHDVAFTPGFLREMINVSNDESIGMIHGKGGDYEIGGYDLFLIRDWVVQDYGLFDENLYPAYNEDTDHIMRFIHRPIRKYNMTIPFYHGETTDYYESGSQTYKEAGGEESELFKKLFNVNQKNFEYMNKKWGEGWRQCAPYKHPFNEEKFEIGITTYDLSYVRQKHLGF